MFLGVFLIIFNGGNSWAARGGTPGTADRDFNPAADTEDNHCVNPLGIDLNSEDWYDVSENIIGPAFCPRRTSAPFAFLVNSGEFIVAPLRFIVNNEPAEGEDDFFPLEYPEGYVPNGTPLEDAISKFTSVRVTIDEETVDGVTTSKHEYIYAPEDIMKVTGRPFGYPNEFYQIFYLPKVPPQPVGLHALRYYWTVSEDLCNGSSVESPYGTCLSEGEHQFPSATSPVRVVYFEVIPGAQRGHQKS